MAIIIDDFGYTYNETVKEFIFLKYPITLSIIPGLKASKRIARDAALAEKEYIIHLPMEPLNEKYDDHGYTIRTDLDDEVIRFRVRAACSNLPDAAGVNNHQGSKVTADQHIMNIVINELAKQGKYFIDSRTTQNSVAYHTARNHNIKTAENQLFLDARNDQDFISEQIQRLAQLAVEKGSVVAIGHVRENTLKVLERKMAELDSRGIEFVHASDIVH
jgi:hypothetical protein